MPRGLGLQDAPVVKHIVSENPTKDAFINVENVSPHIHADCSFVSLWAIGDPELAALKFEYVVSGTSSEPFSHPRLDFEPYDEELDKDWETVKSEVQVVAEQQNCLLEDSKDDRMGSRFEEIPSGLENPCIKVYHRNAVCLYLGFFRIRQIRVYSYYLYRPSRAANLEWRQKPKNKNKNEIKYIQRKYIRFRYLPSQKTTGIL